MHLDVFSLDLLQAFTLALPVLVKVGECISHVVNKELGQLFVVLDHIAEKFAEVVVYNATEFLLKGEGFEVFPLHAASLECKDSVLEFIYLLGLLRHKLVLLALHAAHYHNVVRVQTECKEVCDLRRHLHFKQGPDVKLQIEALYGAQERVLVKATEKIEVLVATFAS